MKSRYPNDGSSESPKLRVYLNLDNVVDLRADTVPCRNSATPPALRHW